VKYLAVALLKIQIFWYISSYKWEVITDISKGGKFSIFMLKQSKKTGHYKKNGYFRPELIVFMDIFHRINY